MQRRFLNAAFVLIPAFAMACGGGGNSATGDANAGGAGGAGAGGGSGGSSDLPCDVGAIVKAKCQTCHSAKPVAGAPMPLVTAADFQMPANSDPSKKVYELVGSRIHDPVKPMPQPPTMLETAELQTLDAWIAAGAQAGSCNSGAGGGGGGGGNPGLSCTPDVKIRAASAWSMPQATTDEYVCFGMDVPAPTKRQITAIAPAVDNNVIVHHMLFFEMANAVSTTPVPCNGGTPAGSRLLSVWAPGGQPVELPKEAGMPIEGTGHYLVQVHYSNLMQLAGQSDQSGFDLCTTTDLRPNDADIMAFGTMKLNIPPHGKLDVTCKVDVPAAFPQVNVYGIMPHMHKLGTIISGDVKQAGGALVDLTNRDPWSFDSQYWDLTKTTIGPGDTVTTRCVYENPGNTNVTFGEKTDNERCYVFAAYYPRISLAQWSWMLPAISSTCTVAP